MLCIGLVAFGVYDKIPVFTKHNNNISSQKQKKAEQSDTAAYSEFKLAPQIDSKNGCMNQLICETLGMLCENENEYCEDFHRVLGNII